MNNNLKESGIIEVQGSQEDSLVSSTELVSDEGSITSDEDFDLLNVALEDQKAQLEDAIFNDYHDNIIKSLMDQISTIRQQIVERDKLVQRDSENNNNNLTSILDSKQEELIMRKDTSSHADEKAYDESKNELDGLSLRVSHLLSRDSESTAESGVDLLTKNYQIDISCLGEDFTTTQESSNQQFQQ